MQYSLFTCVAAVLSASLALAQKQLAGNPVYLPDQTHPATAGVPYTIEFNGDGLKTVDLILLKGPATNILPIATIATGIPVTPGRNKYIWTPSTDLENLPTEGYGIKLVSETGDYQWSTQFGIKNEKPKESKPRVSTETPTTPTTPETTAEPTYAASTNASPVYGDGEPTFIYSTEVETVTVCYSTETPVGSGYAPPTNVPKPPAGNSTIPVPSVPASIVPTPFTGAAGRIQVGGLLIAAVVGVVAF